jgi:hypothetical protein
MLEGAGEGEGPGVEHADDEGSILNMLSGISTLRKSLDCMVSIKCCASDVVVAGCVYS